MAEQSKGGLSRKVQKTFTRTKAKLLINFGKADKTSDEQFDDHVAKLDKQQETSHKFQKELRNYIHCARGLQNASRSLYTAIQEVYEPEWPKNDALKENLESMELMWGDYLQKLQERVQDPLTTYISHIPNLKVRISKRGRKLVDFDNARHSVDVLQNAKKKDENKIAKSVDDLNEAKKIYSEMNEQLHNDLPQFYDSRINFYGESFESLFGADYLLHSELARMTSTLTDLSHELAVENADKVYRPGSLYKSISTEHHNDLVNGDGEHTNGHDSAQERDSPRDTPPEREARPEPVRPPPPSIQPNNNGENHENTSEPDPDSSVYENQVSMVATEALSPEQTNGDSEEYSKPSPQPRRIDAEFSHSDDEDKKDEIEDDASAPEDTEQKGTEMLMKEEPLQAEEPSSPIYEPVTASPILPPQTVRDSIKETIDDLEAAEDEEGDDNVYQVPTSNVPIQSAAPDVVEEVKPSNTLYIVTATHSYSGEDEDELTFPVGQKIFVVPFDDPEDQDEGWLYGAIPGEDGSFRKGVFPANFTQRC